MNRDNIVIFEKATSKPFFLQKNETEKDLERYKNSPAYTVFEVEDKVAFQGHAHLEKDGKSKLKTGVIKKMGWATNNCRSYIVIGIKVEGEEFGSALLYNYTMHPISLTKV